jgi:hypothetical protein
MPHNSCVHVPMAIAASSMPHNSYVIFYLSEVLSLIFVKYIYYLSLGLNG